MLNQLKIPIIVAVICSPCLAEEADKPSRHALDFAEIVIQGWKKEIALVTENASSQEQMKMVREKLQQQAADFDKSFDWQAVKSDVARVYAQRYTDAELQELLRFYNSKTGQKYLAGQIEIRNDVMRRVAQAKLRLPRMREAESQLEALLETLKEPRKKKVQAAIDAKPFPMDLIEGRWYGDDFDKDGNGFRIQYDRFPSGLKSAKGVKVEHASKHYSSFEEEGIWLVRGKVLVESDFAQPEFTRFYVIQSATKDTLVLEQIYAEIEGDLSTVIKDTRKKVELPTKPDGYSDKDQ